MIQQLSTKVQTRELKDVDVSFTKDIQATEKGQHYMVLDNEKYSICLFAVKATSMPGKRSYLKYNARVHLKNAGILFYMTIREMVEDGTLIAGQSAKAAGFRAVVAEWSPVHGVAYERLAIPDNQYYELMSMIRTATAA